MFTRLPETTQRYLLRDAEKRDPVTARRSHLARLLLRERYLTRESLMFRVESLMGFASFGEKSWQDNFYRDMRVVKAALKQAGFDLKYSRAGDRPGYYIAGGSSLHLNVITEITGALGEIDQEQIEIYKFIPPAQKFFQACSIINLGKKISMQGIAHEHYYLSFEEFLKIILSILKKASIDYMVGGAVAAWPWGEPRSTQDINIVMHLGIEQINALSQELEEAEIYLPPDIILENLNETRGDLPINAIHGASGYKAEMFLMRDDDELRKTAFQRRVEVDFGSEIGEVFIHSPEDLIIYKMLYYSLSQQTKHIRDIGSIIKTRGDELDYEYIQKWAIEKQLTAIWQEIQRELDMR